ncbi:hypothetical protein AB0F91_42965 [Amycolatopsis sp. NPDC023774]|uniref:hypothetical protein n=1 Tax=Amycolatopsis sp. NPDC023774 TaxID=3155015 RepID=UPI003410661F
MQVISSRRLRDAIAEHLKDGMTRQKIENFFEDLGLAPWPDEYGSLTKAAFVWSILSNHDLVELADVARRVSDEIEAPELAKLVDRLGPTGVAGDLKNLIFAADGPKPKIVFRDAINNDIDIVENAQYCLVYDRPLGSTGLTWGELTAWWAERQDMASAPAMEVARSLYRRLDRSLGDNGAERLILRTYGDRYVQHGPETPALIPQVYLHYDPYTKRQGAAALTRQRMDFLLLLPNRARVVIECDGIQHYANDDRSASPRRYAEMVAEDRELRLRGYEVYRFGGQELQEKTQATRVISSFFDSLAERHSGTA